MLWEDGWCVWKKDCVRVVKRKVETVRFVQLMQLGSHWLGVYIVGFSLAAFESVTRVGRLVAIRKIVARIRIVLFRLKNVSDEFCKWRVGQGRPWQNGETKGGNYLINHGRYLELKQYISSKLSTELYADWKFRWPTDLFSRYSRDCRIAGCLYQFYFLFRLWSLKQTTGKTEGVKHSTGRYLWIEAIFRTLSKLNRHVWTPGLWDSNVYAAWHFRR